MGIFAKQCCVRVSIRNAMGETVFDNRIERMALLETVILSMCVEFYNDPAPCELHRNAVVGRAFNEIELLGPGLFVLTDLPERIARYFHGYDAHIIQVHCR